MLSAPPIAQRWLTAILILGAGLRFFPIWFGLTYQYSRPDETEAVGHALGMLGGDLNPHFFHWPSLTFYLFAGVFAVLSGIRQALLDDPVLTRDVAVLTGRLIVAAAGTLTILPVYRLALRVWDWRAGLAAAFFLAVAVLHVRDSHFAMTDVLMTLFVMLALARLVAAFDAASVESPGRASVIRGFAAAGLLAGLATSTKYNAAALAVPMASAQVLLLARSPDKPWSLRAWSPLIAFAAAAVAGFLLGTPYSVLDAARFMEDLRYDLTHLSEPHGIDVGPGWQAHLTRSLPYGCGFLIFAAAIAGIGISLRRAPRHAAVLVAFVLAFLAVLGSGRTVFFRYVMPLVPMACVFAALTAASLGEVISRRRRAETGGGLPTLVVVLVIGAPSLVSSAWMDVLLAKTDSRILAGQWLRGRLRPEHSVYDAGWTYVRLDLRGADYHPWIYDPRTESFGDPDGRTPHWLVISESPLRLYAQAEPSLKRLAAERYTPVLVVPGTRTLDSAAVYDRQDAFFMPFSRFWEVERPGPTITIYRRNE
jgi:4-amino-4-deoxy-L-arabinose transferase-like glycosyltransferase